MHNPTPYPYSYSYPNPYPYPYPYPYLYSYPYPYPNPYLLHQVLEIGISGVGIVGRAGVPLIIWPQRDQRGLQILPRLAHALERLGDVLRGGTSALVGRATLLLLQSLDIRAQLWRSRRGRVGGGQL